ncbi:hypothetical protein CDL15_Pgr018846 [Punica granatum]|uniref:Uncharacterized protein n=1 Tax=Punica granatum TaxID=22663 RepID=A0A218VUP6_PUNGR|nr:hypothetical protein CDL15_Pgr018846 [Punica granatum]
MFSPLRCYSHGIFRLHQGYPLPDRSKANNQNSIFVTSHLDKIQTRLSYKLRSFPTTFCGLLRVKGLQRVKDRQVNSMKGQELHQSQSWA